MTDSRIENQLREILGEQADLSGIPQSRIEELLQRIISEGGGSGGGSADNGVIIVDVELEEFEIDSDRPTTANSTIKSVSKTTDEIAEVVENGGVVFLNIIPDSNDKRSGVPMVPNGGSIVPCTQQSIVTHDEVPDLPEGVKILLLVATGHVLLNIWGTTAPQADVSVSCMWVYGHPSPADARVYATATPEQRTHVIRESYGVLQFGMVGAGGFFEEAGADTFYDGMAQPLPLDTSWAYEYINGSVNYDIHGATVERIDPVNVKVTFLDSHEKGVLKQHVFAIHDTGGGENRISITKETVTLVSGT